MEFPYFKFKKALVEYCKTTLVNLNKLPECYSCPSINKQFTQYKKQMH